MKVNDAHCHYGFNGFLGNIGRGTAISKNSYNSLKKDWNTHNIQNAVVFSQPEPAGLKRYFSELALALSGYYLYKKLIFSTPIDDSLLANNDYSEMNNEISKMNDTRIEFVPFVNSKFEISDIERFDNIKGVKFYEPHNAIPESLLEYLNENELNMVLHLSKENDKNPGKFLEIVENNDGITFQAAHCANSVPEIIGALGEYSNLFVDTSAYKHPYFKHYKNIPLEDIAKEHTDKVIFGSDEPWTRYAEQINQIMDLDLTKNGKEKILRQNYLRVWK